MNVTHTLTIVGKCPVDGATDIYEMTVAASVVIPVETILDVVAAATTEPRYQEDLTQTIADALPATTITTKGTHSGVSTVCIVPALPAVSVPPEAPKGEQGDDRG